MTQSANLPSRPQCSDVLKQFVVLENCPPVIPAEILEKEGAVMPDHQSPPTSRLIPFLSLLQLFSVRS